MQTIETTTTNFVETYLYVIKSPGASSGYHFHSHFHQLKIGLLVSQLPIVLHLPQHSPHLRYDPRVEYGAAVYAVFADRA